MWQYDAYDLHFRRHKNTMTPIICHLSCSYGATAEIDDPIGSEAILHAEYAKYSSGQIHLELRANWELARAGLPLLDIDPLD